MGSIPTLSIRPCCGYSGLVQINLKPEQATSLLQALHNADNSQCRVCSTANRLCPGTMRELNHCAEGCPVAVIREAALADLCASEVA